jgi:hypothetical protein
VPSVREVVVRRRGVTVRILEGSRIWRDAIVLSVS